MVRNKKKKTTALPPPAQGLLDGSQEGDMIIDQTAQEDEELHDDLPPTDLQRRSKRGGKPAPDVHAPHTDDAPPPTHRYSTRAANVDRHPGRDVGLSWKELKLEREAAAAKRADKKAAEDESKRQKAYLADVEAAGICNLAALQAQREADDYEEARYFEASAARGYTSTSLATDAQRPESVPVESPPGSKYIEDSAPDPHSSSQSSSSDEEPEGESVVLSQKRPKAPKKTNAEWKREKRLKVTKQIDDAGRQTKANKGAQPGEKKSGNFRAFSQSADSHQDASEYDPDVYTSSYRAKLAASATAHISKSGRAGSGTPTPAQRRTVSSSSTTSTPRTSVLHFQNSTSSHSATPPRTRATPVRLTSSGEQRSDDEDTVGLGGLDDDDVTISRDSVLGRARGRQPELVAVTHVEPEPKRKPKTKRTAKADMDRTKSRSADTLDAWIRDDFDTTILPSVIHHFGSQRDPWVLDSKEDRRHRTATTTSEDDLNASLVRVLQDLIDHLFPRRQCQLKTNDRIVQVTRQRILNWRRGFMTRAHNIVKAAIDDWKKANPGATVDAVAKWAKTAVHPRRGCAWWEEPKSDQNPQPQGPLMSLYVLKTFGAHFKSITGSILSDADEPIGALSLACAAVELAFKCYSSGTYIAPKEEFNAKNAGEGTDGFGDTTIQFMMEDQKVWEEFLVRARQHAPHGSQSVQQRSPPRSRKRNIFASSSPVRGDDSA